MSWLRKRNHCAFLSWDGQCFKCVAEPIYILSHVLRKGVRIKHTSIRVGPEHYIPFSGFINEKHDKIKSGIFGQRPCLFHILIKFGIKNKLTKKTVKILMRRLISEPSHLDLHCLQVCFRIYLMSEFIRLYPKGRSFIKTNLTVHFIL